jgi:mono/diheme cytochrome c family protein
MKIKFLLIIGIVSVLFACSDEVLLNDNPYENISSFVESIPVYPQRTGDPVKGRDYLIYGDYVDAGIPAGLYGLSFGLISPSENLLDRSGPNEHINYAYTQIKASNGVDIVVPNCMQCHAGKVDGQFVLGLGNVDFDNTGDPGAIIPFLDGAIKTTYGSESPEYAAYLPFYEAMVATSPHLQTEVVGANSADKLTLVLAAHRQQDDLTWSNDPLLPIPDELIPADVPAWWLLKKKNAMFTTGIGRQDFARFMMAASILSLRDSTKAREIDNNFDDVLAYIKTLEAPDYEREIDPELSASGEEIFNDVCSKCHGTYGTNETYPNLLVKNEILETDPTLAETNTTYAEFVDWYNGSWFAQGQYGARIVPTDGYIAPPLDGIWATAPYLHNGSVPTLEDLLYSPGRPDLWRRDRTSGGYDHQKIGLKYTTPESKIDQLTYDASIRGYGNKGHYFGDHLSTEDRRAVLEYLKTL